MKIYNIEDKQEYLYEFAELTQREWGKSNISKEEYKSKIISKINKSKVNFKNRYYCTLILLEESNLVGFISIFPSDSDERPELTPWYATMYVKEEYRGKGYSRILNNAILKEAKKRGFKKIYLKTDLDNYYEKFGAQYLENLKNGEKLYYFDL